MIVLPARQVGSDLRVYCCNCSAVHVHSLDDHTPTSACDDDTLAAWLGYELILVDDVTDDGQLAALALEAWLLSNDWRQCRGRDVWRHRYFGRVSVAKAALLQSRVDAFNAHRLQHLDPVAC